MSAEPIALEGVYLRSWLRPFAPWLDRDDVTEIMVNRPGELFVEIAGQPGMTRLAAPEIDDLLLERLASQIARMGAQAVNRQSPLLAATLPDGARVQMIGPPATRGHWAMAIRRHVVTDLPLEAYDQGPLPPPPTRAGPAEEEALARANPVAFLKQAVLDRRTILISGGTSSGKTTFLNSLLRIVPETERIVLVEDTPEVAVGQSNVVGLVAVRGDQGEARIGVDDLLQAALRLRPDRVIVGEIRGGEATTFLRAINTGHPGSFTTIHANTPEGALDQLALMVMQSGLGLSRGETLAHAGSVIDIVVQLSRRGGQRGIADIRVLGRC